MYCGKDIIVSEAIEKATGPAIDNLLVIARTAKAAGNNKEAYEYFTKVLELNPKHYEAWLGKGESAGWQSTLADFRLPEMITGIENAVKFCPQNTVDVIKAQSANILNSVAVAYNKLNLNHVTDYGRVGNTREEFYTRCRGIVNALELAHLYAPTDKQILDNIITILKMQIEGVYYKVFTEYGEGAEISHVTPQYESELRVKMNEYIEKRRALDSSYQPPVVKKKSGCFIVTATMGSNNHPYVILLRDFRDKWLSRKAVGRIFIEKYYRYSPQLADFIRERENFRRISHAIVVKPSVKLATKLMRKRKA
jgi:tetratricopeptide (TPR) repeat protein